MANPNILVSIGAQLARPRVTTIGREWIEIMMEKIRGEQVFFVRLCCQCLSSSE
jgi:hypothetical protein